MDFKNYNFLKELNDEVLLVQNDNFVTSSYNRF